MSIEQKQNEIVEEFSLFEDWMEKYEHLIEMGKELNPLEGRYKSEENIVKGCQSQVWLNASMRDDQVIFEADSDALISKGLIAMLVRVLSEEKPEDIAKADLHFIDDIGLHQHLSPNRSNGLASMVTKMKSYGLAMSA